MYNITCNTDDNYAQHCTAMLCSLFENNKDEEITVHVLCGNLSETNRQLIKDLSDDEINAFIKISDKLINNIKEGL